MAVCQNTETLRTQVARWRESGDSIAFVPTMGNLHAGHLSLVEIAKQNAERVIVSIYVNPLQFAPDEDFSSYPRTLEDDLKKLDALETDLIFLPDDTMIYPQGEQHSTFVEVPGLSHIIEGECRPGFFRGVATVVLKLFNLVEPDMAVFGEKDFQQLLIIRRLVEDLCLPIKIMSGATLREGDGLAMSSRNIYLDTQERGKSRFLSAALIEFQHQIKRGVDIEKAQTSCVDVLKKQGFLVDYVTLRETSELALVSEDGISANKSLIILAAVKLGKTRLIDNLKFTI
ncbi:MAG TPA: pantoate--beta-alanine ligase [Gammaproteobacteria bacterium]|nr:pantoate--beta-alanine ligase [Gammaproteobacteria bacterium]